MEDRIRHFCSVCYQEVNGIETVRVAVVVDSNKYSGAGSDYKYAYMTSDSYEGTNGEDNDKTTVYGLGLVLRT